MKATTKTNYGLEFKSTDARRYFNLSPDSCHPIHIFQGTVYSQVLRIRRIVSDDTVFKQRLNELGDAFTICGYHKGMLEQIFQIAERKPRLLDYNRRESCDETIIPWIVRYSPGSQETK